MYCVKCGSELPNDAKFCSKCGAKSITKTNPVVNEHKTPEETHFNQAKYKVKDLMVIKISYWVNLLVSILFGISAFVMLFQGSLSSILTLIYPIILINFLFSTFKPIINFPKSMLVKEEVVSDLKSISGYFIIILNLFFIGIIVYAAFNELGLAVLFGVIPMLSILYYFIRAEIILGRQMEIKLDLTFIKVKHNFSNEIEEVSLRKWNEMKKEFGENSYDVIEDEKSESAKAVTIRNKKSNKLETVSLKRWQLMKKMYGEDKFEIIIEEK